VYEEENKANLEKYQFISRQWAALK